jgi:L-amino acid N-acyltransferase YncA
MSDDVVVMPMTEQDWPQVERIYAAGIEAGHATFEATTPPWEAFNSSRLADHRFVAVHHDSAILGWVACSPVSTRPAYAGVVEHSVYVAPTAQGKGIGGLLLTEFIDSTGAAGIWTIQSSIFGENTASLKLHQAHGFRVVGTRANRKGHHRTRCWNLARHHPGRTPQQVTEHTTCVRHS